MSRNWTEVKADYVARRSMTLPTPEEMADWGLRLARIETWHSRETGPAGTVGGFCIECERRWPCDTWRMATGVYVDEEPTP